MRSGRAEFDLTAGDTGIQRGLRNLGTRALVTFRQKRHNQLSELVVSRAFQCGARTRMPAPGVTLLRLTGLPPIMVGSDVFGDRSRTGAQLA